MSSRRALAAAALALFALAACGTNEVLVAKSAVVPAGIDLSGQWRLREETGLEQIERAEREAAGGIPIPPRAGAAGASEAEPEFAGAYFSGDRLDAEYHANGARPVHQFRSGDRRGVHASAKTGPSTSGRWKRRECPAGRKPDMSSRRWTTTATSSSSAIEWRRAAPAGAADRDPAARQTGALGRPAITIGPEPPAEDRRSPRIHGLPSSFS